MVVVRGRSTCLVSPCQTWAKTQAWTFLRRATWARSTLPSSSTAQSPSAASPLDSLTWRWSHLGRWIIPCHTHRNHSESPPCHLALHTRKRTEQVWLATLTTHVCHPWVNGLTVAPLSWRSHGESTTIIAHDVPDVPVLKMHSTWQPRGAQQFLSGHSHESARITIGFLLFVAKETLWMAGQGSSPLDHALERPLTSHSKTLLRTAT